MPSDDQSAPIAKKWLWVGRVMSTLSILMLLFSAIMKFAQPAGVAEGFARLGFSLNLAFGLGILELVCTILYLIPQTSVLGAILLTGYLGGATVTHLRVGDPYFIPIILGMMLWGGLYLRDRRLRDLIPLRRAAA